MRTLTGEYGFYFADFGHKKIPLKRRRAGPIGPASMKKKKLIVNLCKKAFALFVYNIPGICDESVRRN